MRINTRVFTEKQDMMGLIQIPNCPSQFKPIAENLINMIAKPGYSVGDYNTMTQLDKILMMDYWREYDGLLFDNIAFLYSLKAWFIRNATNPELIRRARQWLAEHNYIIIKSDVSDRAYEAGNKMRQAVKTK